MGVTANNALSKVASRSKLEKKAAAAGSAPPTRAHTQQWVLQVFFKASLGRWITLSGLPLWQLSQLPRPEVEQAVLSSTSSPRKPQFNAWLCIGPPELCRAEMGQEQGLELREAEQSWNFPLQRMINSSTISSNVLGSRPSSCQQEVLFISKCYIKHSRGQTDR